MDWYLKSEIRISTANGSPALCKYSVVYNKKITFEVLAGKNMYISIHGGHIHRIFTNLLAPTPADNQIKWKGITHQQERVTYREFTKTVVT